MRYYAVAWCGTLVWYHSKVWCNWNHLSAGWDHFEQKIQIADLI
jgi:hypothetical protein